MGRVEGWVAIPLSQLLPVISSLAGQVGRYRILGILAGYPDIKIGAGVKILGAFGASGEGKGRKPGGKEKNSGRRRRASALTENMEPLRATNITVV